MKILIATNNHTKFNLVARLLKETPFKEYDFVCPADLGFNLNVREKGSLQNRALTKAGQARELVKKMEVTDDIAYFVGIDDGIRFVQDKTTHSDSKKATDRILKRENVHIGDSITIVRAFGFVDQKGNSLSCITRVPMTYIGNPNNIERKEGAYPLEYVLSYEHQQKPINQLSQDHKNIQNQKYMLKNISKTINEFLNLKQL